MEQRIDPAMPAPMDADELLDIDLVWLYPTASLAKAASSCYTNQRRCSSRTARLSRNNGVST
jgi:hypothetical protein